MNPSIRRYGLLFLIAICCVAAGGDAHAQLDSACAQPVASADALRRGVDWLVSQQAADGGWHSTTYGAMRDGAGNTALVLEALSRLRQPMALELRQSIDQGVSFLARQLTAESEGDAKEGATGYPLYASALLLTATERLQVSLPPEQACHLRDFLRSQIGAFDQAAASAPLGSRASEINLSSLRFAVTALRAADALDKESRATAIAFLVHCQNLGPEHDGGFYFTPEVDHPLNKAGVMTSPSGVAQARSYGTATADGICILKACGTRENAPRFVAAMRWLEAHDQIAEVPGFDTQEHECDCRALRFYYYFALAEVMSELPKSSLARRVEELSDLIITQQRPDGSWRNDTGLMREDDPLIATALAVAALASLSVD